MLGITDILTFTTATILIVLMPGPNSIYVFALGQSKGLKKATSGIYGIMVGDGLLMLLVSLGAASVLTNYPFLFRFLQMTGSVYLAYFGIKLFIAGYNLHKQTASSNKNYPNQNKELFQKPFQESLIISLLNPKAIFFFLSFFIQFVDKNYPYPAVPFLVQALIVQLCSFTYLIGMLIIGSRAMRWLRSHPVIQSIWLYVVGGLFMGYSTLLLMDSLADLDVIAEKSSNP